jgi:hypothetical protein
MTENTRERHVEIRWMGDEKTESALLRSLGLDDVKEAASGYCERWMSIPARQSTVAIKALTASGACVLEPKP